MRVISASNINFTNSTISKTTQVKKKNKNNFVQSKEFGKRDYILAAALGLAVLGTAVAFIRTEPNRIQKIATQKTLPTKRRINTGAIEIEVKNFSKDKNVKTLDELSGLEDIKEFINEYQIIDKNPEAKKEHNIQEFTSLLFWGVPGTGKTSAAKGIAKQLDADFIQIDKEFFDSMFISEGPQRLAEVIDQIEMHANKNLKKKVVVFMDEIDGTISIDKSSIARHSEDLINTLKKGMTYLQEKCNNVIFIGATNKDPNGIKSDNAAIRLNPAILSRFKYQIEVKLPIKEAIQDAWIKLMKTGSGKDKFIGSQNEIVAQHFYELGMSYRDLEVVADKLNRLDAVQFCQDGTYNSKDNLIKALLNDEKIGYDSVKKQNLPKEKIINIITSLKESL